MEGFCASLNGPATTDIRPQFQLNEAAKTLMISKIYTKQHLNQPNHRSTADIIAPSSSLAADLIKAVTVPGTSETDSLWLVWIPLRKAERPFMLDINKTDLDTLLSNFQLDRSWYYAFTSTGGLVVLPSSDKHARAPTEYAVFMPDLFAICWNHDAVQNRTRATCWGDDWICSAMQDIISYTISLADHVMFPALLASMMLSRLLDRDLTRLTQSIAEVENRTQYHPWRHTASDVAKGSYASLSARMSGCASALAGLDRIAKVLQTILEAAARQVQRETSTQDKSDGTLDNEVDSCVNVLRERVKMAEVQIKFLTRRAEVQLTALFNLIAQHESRVNTAVAEDSRTIASASKQDSSAMMTLASMTVIYLPGTFVATIFSIPVFQWDATQASSLVSSRFWIYWAFTIPLTIVTILCWLLWTRGRESLYDAQVKSDKQRLLEQLKSV